MVNERSIDARGVKTAFAYDSLNRVQNVTYTGETGWNTPNVTYNYGTSITDKNNGRLIAVTTPTNATYSIPATGQAYEYNAVGQIKKQTQTVGAQSYVTEYGYNLAGQLVNQTYPSGRVVTTEVDAIGRMSKVSDAQKTYLNSVSYNSFGGVSQLNYGNGTNESFVYNAQRLQLTNQTLSKGSEVLQKYDYGYGEINLADGTLDATKNNGQLSRVESFIGSDKQWQQRFAYDSLGRLSETREHRGDTNALSYKQKFDFDNFGNLYRKAAQNQNTGQETPVGYSAIEETDISKATNRFATQTVYDDAGNVTKDTKFRGRDFKYDANGRMIWTKLADNSGV